MKNNYKILKRNNDQLKNLKIDNKNILKESNYSISKINFPYAKLIIVLLLIIVIKYKINRYYSENDFEKYEIDDNQNQKDYVKYNHKSNIFWNYTYLKNEMDTYGLYNEFKFPQMTIIIMNIENFKKNSSRIVNTIKSITRQNFSNIEIILYLKKDKENYSILNENDIGEIQKNDILRIYQQKTNIKEDFCNLINLSNGLYTIFINTFNSMNNIPFNKIKNCTKNNINNYITFRNPNNSNIFLIKTKILKDLIDNGYEFISFNMILDIIKTVPKPKLNYISISLCPDNFYTNLAYVTMSSILSSKSSYTFICFYLIIPSFFSDNNINFLESLYEDYNYFNITYIRMDERYDNAYTDRRITKQAYYRFSLGELLPNINKIIYFDTDIIVYKDLTKFYNINFNGKMILGQPTYGNKNAEKRGFHRINTGVLLLNLLEMRKNHFEEKVISITKKRIKLRYHDQTLLNDFFKQYLGIFPPEYHTRPWSNYNEMKIFNKKIGNVFDMNYFYFAHKYPTIRHFLGSYKPRNPNINFIEDWWFFARKSKYYNKNATSYNNAFSY